jgi:sulfofructosephosphate aldolase
MSKKLLQDISGGYAMLALDQRESLRQMMQKNHPVAISDESLIQFKFDAMKILSESASATLVDIPFGIPALKKISEREFSVILAVDMLSHSDAGSVISTDLIDSSISEYIHEFKIPALKFLILWKTNETKEVKLKKVEKFIKMCEKYDSISVLESIVRPDPLTGWSSDSEKLDAMFESAAAISEYKPDIYKCEVPGHGKFTESALIDASKNISVLIKGEWVVLSNGVQQSDFFQSVIGACAGGASGFLAGRAIWAEALNQSKPIEYLENSSKNSLISLRTAVHEMVLLNDKK